MKHHNKPSPEQYPSLRDRYGKVLGRVACGLAVLTVGYLGADSLKDVEVREPEPNTVTTVTELAQNGCEDGVTYEVTGDAFVIDSEKNMVTRSYMKPDGSLGFSHSQEVVTTYELKDDSSAASIVVVDKDDASYLPLPVVLNDGSQYAGEVRVIGKGSYEDGGCTIKADSIQSIVNSDTDHEQK